MPPLRLETLFYRPPNLLYSFCRHRFWVYFKQWVVRVQSPQGMKRVELFPTSSIQELYEAIHDAFLLDNYSFTVYEERSHKKEITSSKTKTLDDHNIKHGVIVYMKPHASAAEGFERAALASFGHKPSTSASDNSNAKNNAPATKGKVEEDEVDKILAKMDGRIQRKRDPKNCRHGANGGCQHCASLEPWDEDYLEKNKIKHMSFHSYIRKLSSGVDKGKYISLEEIDCKIKPGCTNHKPWPAGACSKCQPPAIALERQKYRHVDSLIFENGEIVDRFLNYWRKTDVQRIGILYGRYEPYNSYPLGIQAVVSAIYEPPQNGTHEYAKLLEDEREEEIDQLAAKLGLTRVGWVFTDLLNNGDGRVKHTRGNETYHLTAQEIILAGQLQNKYPNPSKYSKTGYYGSKFVTVCFTGKPGLGVGFDAYQVSHQGQALIRDDLLVPTKDAPELAYLRKQTETQFVPQVYYMATDEYGNKVKRTSPLPVEYLFVDVAATVPVNMTYTFKTRQFEDMFPIENRYYEAQDFNALGAYLSKFRPEQFLDAVSDFHLLIYLHFLELLPKATLNPLLEAVRTQNVEAAEQWKQQEPAWGTLETLIAENRTNSGPNVHDPEENWTCVHCTFINRGTQSSCEICSLPRD